MKCFGTGQKSCHTAAHPARGIFEIRSAEKQKTQKQRRPAGVHCAEDVLLVASGMKLCLLSALAVLIGGMVSGAMNGYKSGRAIYQFGIRPRAIAPGVASELTSHMDKPEWLNLTVAERNRALAAEFSRSVRRMKWTETGELEWEETKEAPRKHPAP
ncbi:MAG TPA: hypothetical protein VG796_00725 [Verrucomicrobiales bacterium]|nr:hypothetical protein [Verrucomicrobiales bacterium]